jgi:hypothetical protein
MTQRSKISPEDLAALLDGRLEGAEREAVLHAVAQDDDAFELFEESIQALEEERAELREPVQPPGGPGGTDRGSGTMDGPASDAPTRFPQRSGRPPRGKGPQARALVADSRWAWAAMISVVIIGAAVWFPNRISPSGRLVASFDSAYSVELQEISTYRSPANANYFLAGRSFFNLALALRNSERSRVEDALAEAGTALSGEEQIAQKIASTREDLASGKAGLRTVRRRARGWELRLGEADAFDLGRWYQGAITALPRDHSPDLAYFSRPAVRAQWQRVYEARDSFTVAGEAIEQIDGLLLDGVTSDEVEALQTALAEIYSEFEPLD